MVAGSIIGGLIALCIVIAIVIVVVHACNCCKTHGIRGHTIRQTPIATVTSRAPYSSKFVLSLTRVQIKKLETLCNFES